MTKNRQVWISLNTANIAAPAVVTCTAAAQDHDNGTGTAAIEVAQNDPIQHTNDIVTDPAMTYHTSHTAAHQVTAYRSSNIIHTKEDHAAQDHTSSRDSENHTLIGIRRSI